MILFYWFLGFRASKSKYGTLIGSLWCPSVRLWRPFIPRSRVKVSIKFKLISRIQVYGLLNYRKIKHLSQRNKKIRSFMHRCCCILYKIRRVIRTFRVWNMSMSNYENWQELTIKMKEKIRKVKIYRYLTEKNHIKLNSLS